MTSPNQPLARTMSDGELPAGSAQTGHAIAPRWAENSSWADSGWVHPSQNISNTERWASAAVGGILTVFGLLRGKTAGWVAAGAGAALLHRGISGHCYAYQTLGIDTAEHKPTTGVPAQYGIRVEETITINRSPEHLFSFWRDVENLSQAMRHLKRVDAIDARRSHWVAEGPLGIPVEWDAEIFNERSGEMIAWRSLPGGDIQTAGSVHFEPLPENQGTVVRVSIKYNPPAGKLGEGIASLLGSGLDQQIVDDLQNLKRGMEAGQIYTGSTRPPAES